ncbi:MAG: mammalian cell entry protein [Mycobacterium sp.]|nr:MAG: mammalian cell entry protein [Mycobacterium sp.]PJE24704.1 MAG: mammalian cell entry protein [Mycobacterium sp.]
MRSIDRSKRTRTGLLGIAFTVLVTAVAQSFTSVPMLFATPTYYAQFADAGGLHTGDKVRIAGVDVGVVRSIDIDGNKVLVGYSLTETRIGTQSRAAIRTDTILGRKNLQIEPRGATKLAPGATLPIGQTTTPYQIYDAFFDITKAAVGWDTDTVRRSLNVLSDTINQSYPHLSAALDGVTRFSDTIGKRDEQIKHLLANANQVAAVFRDRNEQINQLLVNAQTLLATINERKAEVSMLLSRVSAFADQVRGFINDNPNLNHVLEQLHTISDILHQHKDDLARSITLASEFSAAAGESAGSGPYFKAMLSNLIPGQFLQPFIDAAFKKRGLDPEQFWRSTGLPEFRFPDPNGNRFPNGAPPPPPTLLEGTPEHPGPAVPPGSPCSYTPAADALPRPDNPLPCAAASQGPFGAILGGFPAPLDVQTSPPNPDGPPPSPGIPIAGRPGEAPPNAPGAAVPLPPNAPPGARTEQLMPAGPTPPPSTFAPGLPANPPAPPGPGNQLPAPFINPEGTGGSGVTGGSRN